MQINQDRKSRVRGESLKVDLELFEFCSTARCIISQLLVLDRLFQLLNPHSKRYHIPFSLLRVALCELRLERVARTLGGTNWNELRERSPFANESRNISRTTNLHYRPYEYQRKENEKINKNKNKITTCLSNLAKIPADAPDDIMHWSSLNSSSSLYISVYRTNWCNYAKFKGIKIMQKGEIILASRRQTGPGICDILMHASKYHRQRVKFLRVYNYSVQLSDYIHIDLAYAIII